MTTAIAKRNNYTSKKARQSALQDKINLIDEELKKIGVDDMKFRIPNAINNPETPQNTININGITDLSLLFRLLSYFESIIKCKKEFERLNKLPDTFLLKNQNGFLINDIVHDINLRILILTNQEKINILKVSKEKLLPFLNEESRFINALHEIDSLLKSAK